MVFFKSRHKQASSFKVRLSLCTIYILCSACGSSSMLKGEWVAEFQECLLKNKSDRFKDSFDGISHTLHFKENNQVQLIYQQFKVSVKETGEKQLCDVVITGTYSTSLFGGTLYFDFINDETNTAQVSKGETCNIDKAFKLPQKMPEGSPYAQDPSFSLLKVNAEELRLGSLRQTQCQKDTLIFIFKKKR